MGNNVQIQSRNFPGGLRENIQSVRCGSRTLRRDLSSGSPEHKAGIVTTGPRCQIMLQGYSFVVHVREVSQNCLSLSYLSVENKI
jgi:hypothetical protein